MGPSQPSHTTSHHGSWGTGKGEEEKRVLSMWEHPRDVQLAPVRKRKDGEDPLEALYFKGLCSAG